MIIAIGISWRDIDQALRLLNFIHFMNAGNLRSEMLLLVPTRGVLDRRRFREICYTAVKTFGKVAVHVSQPDDESGWPASPNVMFLSALTAVERFWRDDMFWLEADACPLGWHWFQALTGEYDRAKLDGKTFMGAYVKHRINHMTGIGFYGSDWRRVAPSLTSIVENGHGIADAWDCHCAHEIVPHAVFTESIQHKFNKPVIRDLQFLKPEAVLFHQCKSEILMALLDAELYDGEAGRDPECSYLGIEPEMTDMKFFHANNSNRVIKSQGREFRFVSYDQVGGTWKGTYATTDESEIVALLDLCSNPRTAVTEISKEEYEQRSKKKVIVSSSSAPLRPELPQAQLIVAPALLVENPTPSPDNPTPGIALPEKIDDIFKLGKIEPATPDEAPRRVPPSQLRRAVKRKANQ